MRFWIKEGDTAPALEVTLTDYAGALVDLTSATAVRFVMQDKGTGAVIIDAAGAVANATEGRVRYVWQPGDTDMQSDYAGEFEVAFGSSTQTWPTDGYIEITVAGDLDSTLTDLPSIVSLRKAVGEVGETTYTDNELIEAWDIRGELEAAAHDIWMWKAATYAGLVDVNEGGSDRKLSQLLANAQKMADYWASKSAVINAESITSTTRGTRVKKIVRE